MSSWIAGWKNAELDLLSISFVGARGGMVYASGTLSMPIPMSRSGSPFKKTK